MSNKSHQKPLPDNASESSSSSASPLTLADLKPAKGSRRARLRVGRGRASGAGKTSNRGHNGEGQRSGRSRKRGFEGGQMPGYRQMPKINGFHVVNRRDWLELNVGALEGMLPLDVTELTPAWLKAHGYLKPKHSGVRLLGNGDLKRKLVVHVSHASPSARAKVEAVGGSVITPEPVLAS